MKSRKSALCSMKCTGLFPLISAEVPDFNLLRALKFGTLPSVYKSKYPMDELESYVQTYMESEIQVEGLIRKIPEFSRFLKAVALSNGELLNYEKIASDAQVKATTVRSHNHILSDTLLGYLLEPFNETSKRKPVSTSKFYFFDYGDSAVEIKATRRAETFSRGDSCIDSQGCRE